MVVRKPRFVTFEGLDGSGKSTHLRRVLERLQAAGEAVVATQEPGGTPLGEGIRSLFLDRNLGEIDGRVELMLVFASRRQHIAEVIEPALAAGQHVLCDRFTDSTTAYQGYGREVPLVDIRTIDQIATGGRVPDRTIFFDVPATTARERGQSKARRAGKDGGVDRIDAEALQFYEKVRRGYLEIAERNAHRFRRVDSTTRHERTERAVAEALVDLFPSLEPFAQPASRR